MLEERAKHIKIANAVTYAAAKLAKDEIIDRKLQLQQLDLIMNSLKNRVPGATKQSAQPRKFMAKSFTNMSVKSMANTPSTPNSSMSRNKLMRKGSIISANDLDVIDEEEKSVEMEDMTLDRSKI